MDQNQTANIQYRYASQTGELGEAVDPSGINVQPVVALQGMVDNRQVIYTTNDGDGQLQVYHHDGSPAIAGLEGQDTIVFLDEGMEVETETEVATASEAVEGVKYVEESGEQMQKIIIQVAAQDQVVTQPQVPQRIVIPGLENYVVQLGEQEQQPENNQLYQNIQPKSIIPKVAARSIEKSSHKSQPSFILKSPQLVQQNNTIQSVTPVSTSRGDPSQQPKVLISQKQVKHQRKRPVAQNENTEYIYVTRVLASSKSENNEPGKSVYNTIKVYKNTPKNVDEKLQVEGFSSRKEISQQVTDQTKVQPRIKIVPLVSQEVASSSQVVAVSQQMAMSSKQVAEVTQQMTASSQEVAESSKQMSTVSQQMAVTSHQQMEATTCQVAVTPHQVSALSQQMPEAVPTQASETVLKQPSQQVQLSNKPQTKRQHMVSVKGASKNIIRKGGNIFKVDPVSKKIIFEPSSPKDMVSLDENSKNSSDNTTNVDNGEPDVAEEDEEEPEAKKSKPMSYKSVERETTGEREGKWKRKPNSRKIKTKFRFSPEDVAPPPKKQATKPKKITKGKTSKGANTVDPGIKIKEEFEEAEEEESTTAPKKKTDNEEEVEEELEDKKCRMCLSLHNAECPLMRRRVTSCINDNSNCLNSTMLSLQTIPKEFVLSRRDKHGLSVFASDIIKKGTHFGPLVGDRLTFEQISHKMNFTHLWLIETEETINAVDKKTIKYNVISTENETNSNWCRYLRPTLNVQECNVISYCKNEEILFVAREDIQEGEELIVYFRFIEDLHNEIWFADLCNREQKLCKRCEVMYTNLVSYVKHVQVYHPYSLKKLKAICKECGLVLESTGELTKHCKEEHQGNGAFVCKDCGKQFPIPRGLQQHRKFFHIVEGNFPCEHCGKSFFNKFKLRNHMRNKHSGKEHRCEICNKVVGSQNALNRHRKSHTQEGYKFTCDRCGKSCRDNSNLRSHMLTHIKARKFPCTVAGCLMRYGSKIALQMHFAKTHFLSAEQIKVHMLSLMNTNEQDLEKSQQQDGSAAVVSGTQTDLVYELESENDEESSEYNSE
ncbi:uncharacterized protein LOC132548822 [Ylistrum balloti]|uniref:uncharacterized protein LOC132548822 n=1 Tax=Ylistrum balloti TaxID=509963 RepID=UPI002905B0CD|nr:uncharacterized protein LOC132548822 [Ylistrum balloti]